MLALAAQAALHSSFQFCCRSISRLSRLWQSGWAEKPSSTWTRWWDGKARNGIGWLSLREAMPFVRDRGVDPFLPGDGQFSAAGAAAVAEWIRSRGTGLDGLAPEDAN